MITRYGLCAEELNFLVDIATLRQGGRTDHDQRVRSIERGMRLVAERGASGEIRAIAEDGGARLARSLLLWPYTVEWDNA